MNVEFPCGNRSDAEVDDDVRFATMKARFENVPVKFFFENFEMMEVARVYCADDEEVDVLVFENCPKVGFLIADT